MGDEESCETFGWTYHCKRQKIACARGMKTHVKHLIGFIIVNDKTLHVHGG